MASVVAGIAELLNGQPLSRGQESTLIEGPTVAGDGLLGARHQRDVGEADAAIGECLGTTRQRPDLLADTDPVSGCAAGHLAVVAEPVNR